MTLKIEPTFPLKSVGPISKIIVIGCGGTGSFYVRDMARLVGSMKERPQVILVDGDKVEDKNLIRQNFVKVDIGRNKAEVQAGRYGGLGANMAFVDKYLATGDQLLEIAGGNLERAIIVSCVDNTKTRMLIREALAKLLVDQMFWIDCGNEEETGQVVVSAVTSTWKPETVGAGKYPTPDIFDLYPELVERAKADKLPTEMNCAEMAVSSPQFGFVNGTAAMLATNFTHRLLSGGGISVYESCFSIDNRFSHKTLTLSALKSWKNFAAIQKHSLDKLGK